MHLDVLDLRSFYYRTGLGRAAQRAIRDKMLTLWPEALGQSVVGFGFAAPLLRPYLADAKRVIALMPAQQGVMAWPGGAENVSTLCQELRWPLATGMADKVVMLHGLETTETPGALIEECWRVLGPGGAGAVYRAKPCGALEPGGWHAIWAWPPLFVGAAGGPVAPTGLHARAPCLGPLCDAVAAEVLAAYGATHGRFWPTLAVFRGWCADGGGQQAGLRPQPPGVA